MNEILRESWPELLKRCSEISPHGSNSVPVIRAPRVRHLTKVLSSHSQGSSVRPAADEGLRLRSWQHRAAELDHF